MRIQHNIMAMNAYRNLGVNNRSLSGNLEKLSSGYKINRAGDDAAGLAISEKMRAQITALDAAQKNVNDGISLVKTAEGAMQEIQDMLNRMEYLATQSANGTYDNDVDRINLQKEVSALAKEIDRIAEASNFNGTKLLDGSLSGTAVATGAEVGEVKIGGADTPTTVEVEMTYNTDDDQITVQIGDDTFVGSTTSGASVIAGQTYNFTYEKGDTAEKINEKIVAALGENTVTVDGTAYKLSASGNKLVLTTSSNGAPKVGGDGEDYTAETLAAKMKSSITATSKTADGDDETPSTTAVGKAYSASTAGEAAVAEATKATYTFGNLGGAENAAYADGATVTINGNEYVIKTATGGASAAGDQTLVTMEAGDTTLSAQLEKIVAAVKNKDGAEVTDVYDIAVGEDGKSIVYTNQTAGADADTGNVISGGDFAAGKDVTEGVKGTTTLTLTNLDKAADGDTITIGDQTFEIKLANEDASEGNIKLDFATEGKVDAATLKTKLTAALGENAPENYDVDLTGSDSSKVVIKITQKVAADATTGNLESAVSYDVSAGQDPAASGIMLAAAEENDQTETAPAAKGLRLQIGDTSDDYNQLTVTIGDMHTKAMGTDADKDGKIDAGMSIADVDISSQQGASDAVAVIKDAINYVSSVRGDLGAIQNRLEHTNNNLAVMEENIQDAESTIRDTDIADEMMAYTKNNILIQSAQAMLAQANQVPQGVLQLMQ